MKILFNIKNIAFIIFFSLFTFSCNSLKGLEQNNSYEKKLRQKININKDWYYLEYNAETVDLAVSNDKWQKIDIPHTWNAKDATDLTPGYRRDGSWYLNENHCPICSAAKACSGLCKNELDVFQSALGATVKVERVDHILAGSRRCSYKITKT